MAPLLERNRGPRRRLARDDAVVAGLRPRGSELVGELECSEDSYRLCSVRCPEGVIIERAERIGSANGRTIAGGPPGGFRLSAVG